ncbi:hypothetical protein [Thiocystis violacea]|uniref:hypothetical protein n=1 Tax=Thiocystis violacea TaxID=13725 RepID=UPI0019058D92|nr:hypothetical protein [Thiocystis violacea]MBK1718965.1 hypothetical protein [Thiocystis violacea]
MRIEDIQPGMRLAKDIHDPHGHILMRAGLAITERQIRAFKSWGIHEVEITSDEAPNPREIRDPKAIAEIHQLLDTQFSLSNLDHPTVQALHQLCLRRALGQP